MFEEKSLPASINSLGALAGASGIRLDPITPSDEPFLYRTFASTRSDEMALTGWTAEQQDKFLRMQYEAQRRSYATQMPEAEYWVIRRGETAVGRLILDRTLEELHVVDIAIITEFRGLGIGSALMGAILREATETGKAVGLHVERFNPALQWYERLGFAVVNAGPIYLEMLWRGNRKGKAESEPGRGERVCRAV
ncbi:MAG TPA: GNAT family N-acetyltransferase [Candidatus Sulfotelmatobacter sp.]